MLQSPFGVISTVVYHDGGFLSVVHYASIFFSSPAAFASVLIRYGNLVLFLCFSFPLVHVHGRTSRSGAFTVMAAHSRTRPFPLASNCRNYRPEFFFRFIYLTLYLFVFNQVNGAVCLASLFLFCCSIRFVLMLLLCRCLAFSGAGPRCIICIIPLLKSCSALRAQIQIKLIT